MGDRVSFQEGKKEEKRSIPKVVNCCCSFLLKIVLYTHYAAVIRTNVLVAKSCLTLQPQGL